MNDEQKYLFDLQGYLILKGVVPLRVVEACNWAMDRFEGMNPSNYPEPLCLGTDRTETELYIANILEGDPAFQPLIDLPQVIDIVRDVSGETFRLNHTYATWRWKGGYTGIHNHGTPLMDKFQYRCQNGQILSMFTKAVFPLFEANADDGCFAVIPGSHKANFSRPWEDHPSQNPALVQIPAQPGDCILFTETLTHGSTVNTSGRLRRTVFFCYSTGWIPDWGDQGLRFSDRVMESLTETQQDIVRIKSLMEYKYKGGKSSEILTRSGSGDRKQGWFKIPRWS